MMIFCSFKVVFLFVILLLESNQVEVFLCFTCFNEKREFADLRANQKSYAILQ